MMNMQHPCIIKNKMQQQPQMSNLTSKIGIEMLLLNFSNSNNCVNLDYFLNVKEQQGNHKTEMQLLPIIHKLIYDLESR